MKLTEAMAKLAPYYAERDRTEENLRRLRRNRATTSTANARRERRIERGVAKVAAIDRVIDETLSSVREEKAAA